MENSIFLADGEYIESKVGKLYSKEDISKDYIIESEAFNSLLCTKKNDESMCLFQQIVVEEKLLYYKAQ